ncbi:MAG TPA: hypothetical protein VGC42_02940, partial [Kofleriaceae bacterium]
MLAPNPDDRPQTGQEVANELTEIARQFGIESSAPHIAYALTQVFPPEADAPVEYQAPIVVSTRTSASISAPLSPSSVTPDVPDDPRSRPVSVPPPITDLRSRPVSVAPPMGERRHPTSAPPVLGTPLSRPPVPPPAATGPLAVPASMSGIPATAILPPPPLPVGFVRPTLSRPTVSSGHNKRMVIIIAATILLAVVMYVLIRPS